MTPPGSDVSWAFLESFTAKELEGHDVPRWAVIDGLYELAKSASGPEHETLVGVLRDWDHALADIGGDPAFSDWRRFRPLRLSREEDWSDWLAHLIETSTHGFLARELLGDPAARVVSVARELSTDEGFRADLVIRWDQKRMSHVEVKVGDLSFEKTFGTAIALRACAEPGCQWTDHILIPVGHAEMWEQVATAARDGEPSVAMCTWTDIAVALRAELAAKRESVDWRVWAAAFVGAIEQTLLGLPRHLRGSEVRVALAERMLAQTHLEILRKAKT